MAAYWSLIGHQSLKSLTRKVAMIFFSSSSSACLLCCFKEADSADVGLWRLTGFGTRGNPVAVQNDTNANKITNMLSISSSRWAICQTRSQLLNCRVIAASKWQSEAMGEMFYSHCRSTKRATDKIGYVLQSRSIHS